MVSQELHPELPGVPELPSQPVTPSHRSVNRDQVLSRSEIFFARPSRILGMRSRLACVCHLFLVLGTDDLGRQFVPFLLELEQHYCHDHQGAT